MRRGEGGLLNVSGAFVVSFKKSECCVTTRMLEFLNTVTVCG
jgi:hypothetical protein